MFLNYKQLIHFFSINLILTTYKNTLDTPIEYLKGVGPKRGETLKKEMEIYTFGDLLTHFPFRYVDKTQLMQVSAITRDTLTVQFKGTLSNIQVLGEGRGRRLVATFNDGTGKMQLIWFRGIAYLKTYLKTNTEYLVYGKPKFFNNSFSISHPEMELVDAEKQVQLSNRLEAVYSSSEKMKGKNLDSKGLHKLLKVLFEKISKQQLRENLPESIKQQYQLIDRFDAYKNIHLPDNDGMIPKAQKRLKFEELFMIQIRLYLKKVARNKQFEGFLFEKVGNHFNNFYSNQLPFELTNAQKRVLREIRIDTKSGKQMNRLLQGDVGSGKTIVGLMTMLLAIDNGFQACLMAPTEILAQQHFATISKMVEGLGLRVELLTGSVKGKRKRNRIADGLALNLIHILVGTHAVIEPTVEFNNLGVVIIDEQHRFGVAQRAKMWKKNTSPPHILVMTATPIPRTLAMTVYGDLDVSLIDELPPGRKDIKTFHLTDKHRLRVFEFMRKEIALGRQIYIVYPLINESEAFDYKDLTDGYESITRAFPRPQYQVSIVHGQMHSSDKELEMQRFKAGETQIMVATTVIEVGVDVPNASVMIIESAERFGLAQLHQLRGRVGRGASQSYCILMTGKERLSPDAKTRMDTMTDTNDGFKIAEVDMKLRGPGNMAGTQQSGLLAMKIADITKDQELLQAARIAAKTLISRDPLLTHKDNYALKYYLENNNDETSLWSKIS